MNFLLGLATAAGAPGLAMLPIALAALLADAGPSSFNFTQFGAYGISLTMAVTWGWMEHKERVKTQEMLFNSLRHTEQTTVPWVAAAADAVAYARRRDAEPSPQIEDVLGELRALIEAATKK